MADLESVISLVFRGVDQVSEVSGRIAENMGDLNGRITGVAEPFAAGADAALGFEAATVAAGLALINFSVNAADRFETAFREIATLIDVPIEGLQKFRGEILDYAATSTQSLDEVSAAVYNAISNGVAYTKSLEIVAAAEKLAVAGKAGLNDSLVALTSTLNAYGVGTDQATKFSDIFFTTVKLGKTNLPELAASISGVTGNATLGGVSFGELGAAIAVVTAAGAPTSQAVTRINAALGAIIGPSEDAKKLAAELGIEFDLNALKSKGLAGVLADVAEKTGGAGDKMGVLFGSTEALNAVNVLAVTNATKFKETLAAMDNAAGATAAGYNKLKDVTSTLAQAFRVAGVEFGTPLLEPLNKVDEALAAIGVSLRRSIAGGALSEVQGRLTAFANEIGDLFAVMAKNLPAALENVDFGGFLDSFGELGEALQELFGAFAGGIDLRTVEGLRDAIQKIVDSGAALTNTVAGIVRSFAPFADAAGRAVDNFSRLNSASQLDFGEFLGAAKAVIAAGPAIAGALILIGRAGVDMGAIMDVIFGGVKVAINAVQVAFDAVALTIVETAKNAANAALAIADAVGAEDTARDIRTALDGLNQYSAGITENLLKNADEMKAGWAQATGQAASQTAALTERLDKAEQRIVQFRESAANASKPVEALGNSMEQAVKPTEDLATTLKKVADATFDAALKQSDETFKIQDAARTKQGYVRIIEDGIVTYQGWGAAAGGAAEGTQKVAESAKKTSKDLIDATKVANDYALGLAKIASEEKTRTIEAVFKFKTSELEAQTKQIEATFKSIDNTVTTTGELIGDLFGTLANTKDRWTQLEILEQLDLENKRRQDALDMQKKLTEAQIENLNARTRRFNNNEFGVTVNAPGLQPHLEMIWDEILKAIQIKASQNYAEFLIAVSSV